MRLSVPSLLLCLLTAPTGSLLAQTPEPLALAAQKALTASPDVTARFNAFRAAANAADAARAGYGPRLDLLANVGHTSDRIDTRDPASDNLVRTGVALNLSQTLWDGLGNQREVGRLGHEKLARYFEFVDASEQAALDVARTWYDVARFRKLVLLAEDNYVQHRYAYLQIESRVRAGVGRGVDLEQAAARVALAESNLVTETANLHDVLARYLRVVGEAAPADTPLPAPLSQGLPASATEAAAAALQRNAAISASIETLRAAREAARLRESSLQPRVEARVRAGVGHNYDGIADQKRDTTAEITLNWNLYDGGADRARIRQQVDLLGQAADLRDKTCRDTRQTSSIAYNDTRKLVDLILYLERNVLAIQKARDAYRQQFDIGQRSLLDLLNAENELYTARRALANAEYDLGTARARTHASMNQLTVQLGLARIDTSDRAAEAADWGSGEDAPGRCPVEVVELAATPKADLEARAQSLAATAPTPKAPAK